LINGLKGLSGSAESSISASVSSTEITFPNFYSDSSPLVAPLFLPASSVHSPTPHMHRDIPQCSHMQMQFMVSELQDGLQRPKEQRMETMG
jgi:hypothetical protein